MFEESTWQPASPYHIRNSYITEPIKAVVTVAVVGGRIPVEEERIRKTFMRSIVNNSTDADIGNVSRRIVIRIAT